MVLSPFLSTYLFIFGEQSVQISCSLLKIGVVFLNFKSPLQILDTSSLSYMYFPNIYSLSMTFLITFLTVGFKEQKFLKLMKSDLSMFFFSLKNAFIVIYKKTLPYPRPHKVFPLMFSSSFIILDIPFSFVIYYS